MLPLHNDMPCQPIPLLRLYSDFQRRVLRLPNVRSRLLQILWLLWHDQRGVFLVLRVRGWQLLVCGLRRNQCRGLH